MTISDRQLLERAAKAAGYEVARESDTGRGLLLIGVQHVWNPLDDDGDALRLAVKLRMSVDVSETLTVATPSGGIPFGNEHNADEGAATRRAIVRAAASLGEHK